MSLCDHGYTSNWDCPLCDCPCGSGKACGECACGEPPARPAPAAMAMSADCIDGFCHVAEARGEHYRCQGKCAYAEGGA